MMKIIIYLMVIMLALAGCKAKKSYTAPVPPEQPQAVVEEVVAEEQITVKQEDVKLTHGTDIMRYCIILGSFVNEQNAVGLRKSLIEMGFTKSSIMQNKEGMYRVSAACYDNDAQARAQLLEIRRQYAQFQDAWLLQVNRTN